MSTVLFVLLEAVACSPNLDVRAGQLRVEVTEVPVDADLVRVRVLVGVASGQLDETPKPNGVTVTFESVPAGMANVAAEALLADVVIARASEMKTIEPDTEAFVALSLRSDPLDGGVFDAGGSFDASGARDDAGPSDAGGDNFFASPAISWTTTLDESQFNGRDLRGEMMGGAGTPSFSTFIDDARVALGREPTSFEVTKVTVSLGAVSGVVTTLSDLLSSIESVSLADALEVNDITVATGNVTTNATETPLDISTHILALGLITDDLINNTFTIRIRGPSPRKDTDTFSADVRVAMEFVAR